MTEDKKEWHLALAKELFNGVWDYLVRSDRTKEDDIQMIHMVHAMRFHWGLVGTPLEFARADWQVSRVYAELGFGVMSYKYANSSLALCEKHDLGDFDLAFAYEGLARASAVSSDTEKGRGYVTLAQAAGVEIKEDDDREYFFSELEKVEERL
jgi:hypothetical protein